MSKVTMQQIADSCGVSKALVSLALSDKYGVNDKTRSEIVVKAIQMGYDFAKVKKPRAERSKKLLYVLIKDIDLETDRFWPQIIKGITEEVSRRNCKTEIKTWSDSSDYQKLIADIVGFRCSGVIIISEMPQFIVNNIVLSKIPAVLVDGKEMIDDIMDTISVNNYFDFYRLTEYVIRMGHKHLAFVGDRNYAYSYHQRLNGFTDCIRHYEDIRVTYLTQKGNDATLTYCYNKDAVSRSLDKNEIDCYLCASDNICEKIYEMATVRGLRIPEDISVCGFDDNLFSKTLKPALTTVRVPKNELGKHSVTMLLERINSTSDSFKRLNVNGELVIRDSVECKAYR